MNESQLTIKQAAEALGVSTRTIRRRITEGDLSASKQRRGKQDVTLLDGAEVARWAQASGLTMTPPGQQAATPPADTVPDPDLSQDTAAAEAATYAAEVGQWRATCDGQRETIAAQAVTIAALQGQVAFLQEQVSLLTVRALPQAPGARPSWWQRMIGRGEKGEA